MPYDSVLLIAFGGPTRREEIRPFLEIVARGRRIPLARLEAVAHHYEQMPGGRSPLNELTQAQARGLEQALAASGLALPVFVGMRNWHPFLSETLADMAARGHRKALGIILSAARCEASWDRYHRDVADARERTPGAPEIEYALPWFDHPLFHDAVAARAREAIATVPTTDAAWTPLVFTAHSIPIPMAAVSPYVRDLTVASRAVARRLDHRRFSIAYQSRSGAPGDAWLEPDIGDVLRSLGTDGEKHAVVVPVGFVCDHVEVLHDLDVEAREVASTVGLTLHRASTVNDHPLFVAMLADVVHTAAA